MKEQPDICRKCGGTLGKPMWCAGSVFHCTHESWRSDMTNRMDHLVRTCQTCGWQKVCPTLDDPKGKP